MTCILLISSSAALYSFQMCNAAKESIDGNKGISIVAGHFVLLDHIMLSTSGPS